MGDKMYRRLCKTLSDKGVLIPTTDNVYDHIKNLTTDHYLSLYQYNEDQKTKFYQKTKKLNPKTGKMEEEINGAKGITDVRTNILVFDFDHKTDLELAKSDTMQTCNRLLENGFNEDDLIITFSGNKGFGIEVHTKDEFTPDEVKGIAKHIAGDLATFDPIVFNASRIFRVSFTRHQESGLFKTPLTYPELFEMEINEIKDLASEEYEPENIGKVVKTPSEILKLKDLKPEKKKVEVNSDEMVSLDLKNKPRWLSNWKYALQEGFFPEGVRNHAMMILGATYKGQGFNKITAYRMLKGAAELQSQRTGQERYSDEEIWREIIEQIYHSGWMGGTYAEENFSDSLVEYLEIAGVPRGNEEDDSEEVLIGVDDVYNTFEDFAENIEANTIKTGIRELDERCRITTSMLVGLLGAPGSGKTATVLNILENHSNGGEESIFFSFDMGKPLIYQKLAQKYTGYDSKKLFEIFQNKQESEKERIRTAINTNFKNVQMSFKTGSRPEDIKKTIMDHEQRTGKKVRFIVVDYLEKCVGPFSDATANSGYNAAKLQEICNDLEICCFLLLQPQKMAGDPSEPLLTYRRVKGASVIEQDCRVIISVFREGYDPQSYENDRFITYAVLKNTMGELGSVDCTWEGLTGTICEIADNEREDLKYIRKQKAEKRALASL
jgi:replicative DNA helicase